MIIVLPFVGFLLAALFGRFVWEGGAPIVIGAIGGSSLVSLYVLIQVLAAGAVGAEFRQIIPGYVWIPVPGSQGIEFNLLLDNLKIGRAHV